MADEIEVTVKLRWVEYRLFAGIICVGRMNRLPIDGPKRWAAFSEGFGIPVEFYRTEAEATRAVEAAAIKALKGDADE